MRTGWRRERHAFPVREQFRVGPVPADGPIIPQPPSDTPNRREFSTGLAP